MTTTADKIFRLFRAPGLLIGALLLAACDQTIGFGASSTQAVDARSTVKVALLAPLGSGKSELDFLGNSLVNAARLANNDLADVDLDIKVYPTGGDAGRAAAAAQQAVAEGAQIFVGPLFSTAAASVAPIAAQNGLSVLSFSNNTQVAGNNLYLLGVTFDSIADRVVGHAVANGQSNIAVIHSADPAGAAGLNAANKAIARYGASFAGSFPYELSPQGISTAAPTIARQVTAAGATAVVLTDDPGAGLVFLTPVLASAGLNAKTTKFLGLTRWNSPAEAASTPSMQQGVFATADPGIYGQFETRYSATYGTAPHNLAGLAYDGIAAVGAMVKSARASGNGALTREQITDPRGFAGVNGVFRLRNDGGNDRGLALMQLRAGQTVVLESAPRSFGVPGS